MPVSREDLEDMSPRQLKELIAQAKVLCTEKGNKLRAEIAERAELLGRKPAGKNRNGSAEADPDA